MFKIFKKETGKAINVKTTNELIEEIHETFFTEVDRLLAEANIKRDTSTDKDDLLAKARRLNNLGFTATEESTAAQLERNRIESLKSENKDKESLKEAIHYFSFKYPLYKFITVESVKKICEKYNLVYGPVSRYIGTVPDKNLEEIDNFKIAKEDECYEEVVHYQFPRFDTTTKHLRFCSSEVIDAEKRDRENYYKGLSGADMHRAITVRNPFDSHSYQETTLLPLEICAPLKDFNMKDHEIKDFKLSKIEIPDPVVLKPVHYKSNKYYLVVSAWGVESSDELVVNQRMN